MARVSVNEFLRCLTRGAAAEMLADHSDGQLVERALDQRDEAAFGAILRRHGPMVYRVCWRNLEHPQDAEDAFQATFLVLAQKLPTLRKHASLASWLHGVAHRVALKAKARAAGRRRREQRASRPITRPPDDVTWGELRSALDGELSRLPDKWRLPLVLCYLEGRTQEEAASQLRWSKSTLRRRLEEARTALANRLNRRGIVLPAALSAVLLSDCLASAAPAPGLVAATVMAAAEVMAGKTLVLAASAKVASLAQGALKMMALNTLKWRATLFLLFTVLATGTAGFTFRAIAGSEPQDAGATIETQTAATDQKTASDEAIGDAKSLQGSWQVVDAEKNGKSITEDPTLVRMTFKGEDLSFLEQKLKYRLDAGKSPRELHLIFLEGKQKGQSVRAIYALEKDELKICVPLDVTSTRPMDFKTKQGDGLILFVLRRPGAGVQKPDAGANVQRAWLRTDAPPDGNYSLSYVSRTTEYTACLIRLETKEGKQSAALVDAGDMVQVSAVRMPALATPPISAEQSPASVPIRLVCATPNGDIVFEGSFLAGSSEARGHMQFFDGSDIGPAKLRATSLTKLKYTSREVPNTPLYTAMRLASKVNGLRQRAEFTKDATDKADYLHQASLAEREMLANVPKLYKQGFATNTDDPLAFESALDAARFAVRYHFSADQLRGMIAVTHQSAASYGRRWQQEFDLQIAATLAPQKEYAPLAVEMATRLEKELAPTDADTTKARVLKALATAQSNAGGFVAGKESPARLLARAEEILDHEYRSRVPPFKPEKFAGPKTNSSRAVVLELFTGTQCPPCVAASVAFDALHETYQPTELVLLQYHLHVPGPDPLTNPDSEARWAYYGKAYPDQARGVPTTIFNGKIQAAGGGSMPMAQEKYKQYRNVIDPLLAGTAAATLSASAGQQGNQITIQAEVAHLKNPGANIRLRLLLAEEMVRYVGGNRVRLHPNVVRSMVGGPDGFALTNPDSKHAATVDLAALRKSLTNYLEDYHTHWRPLPNPDRPLDLANLRLIALVQDDTTHEILQAVQAPVGDAGK